MNETERRRRERSLFVVLLLLGICIMLYVGQIAIRIAPNWEVAANMRSNLDPNIDFLTGKNSGIVEPLNPDILTLPAWLYIFTPNATMPTSAGITPPATQAPTRPATLQPTIVNTLPATASTIYVSSPTRPGKTPIPTTPIPRSADLVITKTDGSPTYFAGGVAVYQIIVSNPGGPANVTGARVTDNLPAQITSANWICVSAGGATCTANGAGNINTLVNLPVGSSVTYTIVGAISMSASGNLVNTASVSLPAGFSDPVLANNTATDSDTLALHSADLSISKTDVPAVTTYTVGGSITYRITVSNNGTTSVTGATVTDNFPAQITGANWICVSAGGATCPAANGSGNINALVNLPVGSSVTYTVAATISPSASGNLVNTASVSLPAGFGDTNPVDNTATDTDTPIFSANLGITKTDGSAAYTVGGSTTYTITVSNLLGPANVTGAVVTDPIPSQIASWSWTCTSQLNGASGCDPATNNSSSFSDTVNLPVGSSITYTVIATISPSAFGNLVNLARVNWPAGSIDITATDTDTPVFTADLQISKTDGSATYNVGGSTTYTITVSNLLGPANVTGAVVTDLIPSQIASWSWTCTSQLNGASGCDPATSNSSNFSDTVNLPVGSSITYTVIANIRSSALVNLVNSASINWPAGSIDITATDTDTPIFNADLDITKTDGNVVYVPGARISYQIVVTNGGPSDASGFDVTDTVPPDINVTSVGCATSGAASCGTNGTAGNNVSFTGMSVGVGASITITINGTVNAGATADLVNTADIFIPGGAVFSDPNMGNNTSPPDTDTLSGINIGPPDTTFYSVPKGSPLTIVLSSPITAGGDGNPDFVYYERSNCTGVCMDFVKVEISSDGSTWHQVFYWGDGISDTNTNLNLDYPAPLGVSDICQVAGVPTEVDNCDIPVASLYPYPGTGIAIDIDSLFLSGSYSWVRITSPLDGANTAEIDAIQLLP